MNSRPSSSAVPKAANVALVAALVFFCGLAAFLTDIGSPDKIYFDETWYVPTAREWLASGTLLHPEHPPLSKLMIAASLALFGDAPSGWRTLGAIFGAVTLVAVFLWTLALLDSLKAALWAAAITLVDQILYVQSRIAMLDIFLVAFATLGLAAFTYALRTDNAVRSRYAALASGFAFGLAGACKISGFFPPFGDDRAERDRRRDPAPQRRDPGLRAGGRRRSATGFRGNGLLHYTPLSPIC